MLQLFPNGGHAALTTFTRRLSATLTRADGSENLEAVVLVRRLARKHPELYTEAAARGTLFFKRRVSMICEAARETAWEKG